MEKEVSDNNSSQSRKITFGELIQEAIDKKGWTQETFQVETGFKRQMLTRIYNGHIPQKKTVIAICIALGLSLEKTVLFMFKAGYVFIPDNNVEKIYISFLTNNDTIDLFEYNEFVRKEIIKCPKKECPCQESKDIKTCNTYEKYKKYFLYFWKKEEL